MSTKKRVTRDIAWVQFAAAALTRQAHILSGARTIPDWTRQNRDIALDARLGPLLGIL